MIRKTTLLFIACMGLFYLAQSQLCAFDQKHQQMMAQDPVYAQKVQQMNNQIASMIQNNPNGFIVNSPNGPVYQVPLVIHVVHTGGTIGSIYNPTDAQLINMVNYLNQAYAATWPSYPNMSNGGTFIPLQFVLAQRTPSCTPSTGINRVNGSGVANYVSGGIDNGSSLGASEVQVKALSIWPNTEYYNIWVVNKIDGNDGTSGTFTAGYAYFPGASAAVDGTVMLATQANQGKITLPHEIGHAFALYHTFEGDAGGTTCPPNANCATQGDRVCDTDPHKRSLFNCPSSSTNSCTGNPFGAVVRNFMDYSSCQDRFTPGQSTRIQNAIVSNYSRSGLISSLGGTAISGSLPAACIPTITNPGNSSNAGPRDITISDANFTYMRVTSSGYNNDGNLVYIDNTCKHQVELTAGNIYNFSVKTGVNTENVKVFVDYNNDGTFQANEEIWSDPGTVANQTHSFQYTVPTTATIPGLVSCIPLRMRIISDRTISPAINPCGPLGYGQAEDYSIIIRGGGPSSGAVSVALTSGSNPSCFNSPLTFSAVPGAGVTIPSYVWYVNGATTGITTTTYSSSTLVNNDTVSIKMYFTGACGNDSSMSAPFVVLRQATVPAAVTISVTAGSNPGCAGQALTFTANPVNGGTSPSYQWRVNGLPVGTNSPTYSAILNNNDVVTTDMTSNSACASPATANSDTVVVIHTTVAAGITINLIAGNNPSCSGKSVTFDLQTTNAGSNPTFQWNVNGIPVPGATNGTFTSSTLNNNDNITAVLNATDPCVTTGSIISNAITMGIIPKGTPIINVSVTKGSNPGCLDSLIEFTASVVNHGAVPLEAWQVNGIQVGTGLTYSTTTLLNGDVVEFKSTAIDGGCYSADTAYSAPVVMSLFSTPTPPVISFIGTILVANDSTNISWYGPNGLVAGANGLTLTPSQPGVYYAVRNNVACPSKPSNLLTISITDINTYDLSQVTIYPNPTNGKLSFDWGTQSINAQLEVYNLAGQGLLHEAIKNQNHKTLDLTHFANGTYFVVIKGDSGKMGTVKVVLNK